VPKKNAFPKNGRTLNDLANLTTATYRGLCSTCKHSSGCTYPRDPNRPVVQCEEFEGILKASEEVSRKYTKFIGVEEPKAYNEEPTQLKGLCKLCEKRATCTYPKPEGGVWHCVEYE
jgi:hypothetical protein